MFQLKKGYGGFMIGIFKYRLELTVNLPKRMINKSQQKSLRSNSEAFNIYVLSNYYSAITSKGISTDTSL